MGSTALHRRRLPARILSQLSRLSQILPALGSGALPKSESQQFAPGGIWPVTILAVTGLAKEAKIVGVADVVAIAGGGNAPSLASKLSALHGDIEAVISIGVAGALSPHLKVGDVVIADEVLTGAERWQCHEIWRVRLMSRLAYAHQGHLFGSDVIIENPQTKSSLYDLTGALAVDMESQIAARFARSRNLPLAGLRVISDDAFHVLPAAALVAMKADGSIALGRVLVSLLKKPGQVPALIRTARASNKAFAQLLRCLDLCGVGIAGTDL
jgi:adenosylhomocysteine nucleosidase